MLRCVFGRCVSSTVVLESESADRVGRQLRGNKECPVGDVTNSGGVLRKVPESDARSVTRLTCPRSGVCVSSRFAGTSSFIASLVLAALIPELQLQIFSVTPRCKFIGVFNASLPPCGRFALLYPG